MPQHDYCKLVLEHHASIAALEKGMVVIEKNMIEQTCDIKKLEKVAADNRVGIQVIKDKLDNGITAILDEIKSEIVQVSAVANGREEERRERAEVRGIAEEERDRLKKEIDDLKADSWVVKLLALSVKKVIGIIFVALLLSSLLGTGFWAFFKSFGFQETPGQQKATLEIQKNGYRTQALQDGRLIIHANDENKPAWLIDPKTKIPVPCPQFRTDAQIKKSGQ